MSDSNTRVVIAAILTAMALLVQKAMSEFTNAYRTCKLKNGINEGAYIAMASNDIKYKLYSLRTRWMPVILIITFITYAPNSLQTFANFGIKTVNVYVMNKSTVNAYNARSNYNSSTTDVDIPPYINYAISMLSTMSEYGKGSNSRIIDNIVITNLLRNNFVSTINFVSGDSSNSFMVNEVISTVYTQCSQINIMPSQLQSYIENPYANAFSFLTTNTNNTYVYSPVYNVISNNEIIIDNILVYINNQLSSGNIQYYGMECLSTIIFKLYNAIFTISTGEVQIIKNIKNDTTINAEIFGQLIVSYSKSIEGSASYEPNFPLASSYLSGISDVYYNFPQGLFNDTMSNVLHCKIVAATSRSLERIWDLSNNNFTLFNADLPLYNIVLQTYVPTYVACVIACIITGVVLLICIAGMTYASTSLINIKDANEVGFIYNVDNDFITTKRLCNVSNDPSEQRKISFSNNIYCKEETFVDYNTGKTVKRVALTYKQTGNFPRKDINYD